MWAKQLLCFNNNIIYLSKDNAFKPPVALAAISSIYKAVVLVLLIYFCMYLPLFVGVLC